MTTWVIISWIVVAILTIINVVFFFKLKKASEQMMKMAFPNARNMKEAMNQMQGMVNQARRRGGTLGFQGGKKRRGGGQGVNDPRLQQAMDMLSQMQKPKR